MGGWKNGEGLEREVRVMKIHREDRKSMLRG
jgi:hypothetical protein